MKAAVGDMIVVERQHVGTPPREAEILAVEGKDGAPPYRVRWSDDGHEGLYFPGSDARVVHLASDAGDGRSPAHAGTSPS